MNFLHPHYLFVWLLLPLIYWGMKKARISITHPRLSQLEAEKKWSLAKLTPYLPLLAFVLWVVAMATPQKLKREQHQGEEGIAIEMLLDISTSMDINTTLGGQRSTRMEVAKQVLKEFVIGDGQDLKGRPNDLIGVITFSRYADTLCPLTLSHKAIAAMIDDVTVNERPNEDGTAYGDATALGAALLKKLDEQQQGRDRDDKKTISKVIVLLTDGENNCGRYLPLQAAAMAKAWGIRVYSISLGDTPDSQTLKVGSESIKSERGYTDAEWGLKELADSTGGFFSRAHNYETLKDIYRRINELETSQLSVRSIERFEANPEPWAMAGMLCLLFSLLINLLGWRTST